MNAMTKILDKYIAEHGEDDLTEIARAEIADAEQFEFKIARLDVKPGKTLIVKVAKSLNPFEYGHFKEHVEQIFPGVKIVVVDGTVDMAVMAA